MAGRRNRSDLASAREHFSDRALETAKRVPWRRIADAVDQVNEWEAFGLWIRAVCDAAHVVPPEVQTELDARIPGLLARDLNRTTDRDTLGYRLWNLIGSWVENHVLAEAKSHGWLDAVNWFTAMSLSNMKAWALWDRVDVRWRTSPPPEWPTYEQWRGYVAAITELPNPDSEAQRILNAVTSVSPSRWEALLSKFFDLVAFSMWIQVVINVGAPGSPSISTELADRYRGFSITDAALSSSDVVRDLHSWAMTHELRTSDENLVSALRWHARNHPSYYAWRNYAAYCHEVWNEDCPSRPPSFDEWRKAADAFTS